MTEYAWFTNGNGRSVYRRVPEQSADNRSGLPCPQILNDRFDQPTQSMADGKYYTSKAAMRESYKASGNPQGVDYVEVGNADLTKFEKPKRDKAADMAAFKRAEAEVAAGIINPKVITERPV